MFAQDFSGSWRLRSARTDIGSLPEQPAANLEIDQRGGVVRCTASTPGHAPVSWQFTLDGKDTKSKSGAVTLSTASKWEGAALLVNTIVNGASSGYTQMDRWRLSREGATLTIHREIIRRLGGAEAVLVYENNARRPAPAQAAPPAPAAITPAAPVVSAPSVAPSAPTPAPSTVPAPPAAKPVRYEVESGTRIPLTLINSVSTKQSSEGDRLYLSTAFPILAGGRIVIPPGSYVAGTLTFVKRPGRLHGRGELYLRFDSITLPNGVTRDFRSRVGALDGQTSGELDRREGNIRSEGSKGADARTIGEAGAAGAGVGGIAGAAAGHAGLGAGIGAGAGAAAGVMAVLLTRGPDLLLARGTTVEMVLDRKLVFTEEELSPRGWRRE